MEGLIRLSHVPTQHQVADILTKPLTGLQHHSILSKLGVHTASNLKEVLELLMLLTDAAALLSLFLV